MSLSEHIVNMLTNLSLSFSLSLSLSLSLSFFLFFFLFFPSFTLCSPTKITLLASEIGEVVGSYNPDDQASVDSTRGFFQGPAVVAVVACLRGLWEARRTKPYPSGVVSGSVLAAVAGQRLTNFRSGAGRLLPEWTRELVRVLVLKERCAVTTGIDAVADRLLNLVDLICERDVAVLATLDPPAILFEPVGQPLTVTPALATLTHLNPAHLTGALPVAAPALGLSNLLTFPAAADAAVFAQALRVSFADGVGGGGAGPAHRVVVFNTSGAGFRAF